jgi:protein arginine N-methyltransferase 3
VEIDVVDCQSQDINTHTATVDSLEFQSEFTLSLASEAASRPIRAFTTWFDTFFAADSGRQASPEEPVQIHRFDDNAYAQPVEVPQQPQTLLSFTTGPRGKITHWKQVSFMLRNPATLERGELHCRSFWIIRSRFDLALCLRSIDTRHFPLQEVENQLAGA